MTDTNEVMITGRILHDPITRTTRSGDPMCTFQLAVARPEPSKAYDYLDVIVWQPLAEAVSAKLCTGKRMKVRGYLRKSMYDGNDGRRHSSTKIEAKEIEELGEEEEENAESDPFPSIAGAAA